MNIDKYMEILYKLVNKSYKKKEIPVGSIVIYKGKVIGKGYNNRQSSHKICGHAEINAILEAEKHIKDWRLDGCILISTLKPCEMCYKVIKEARIDKVYYLYDRNNNYNDDSIIKVNSDSLFNNKIKKLFDNFFVNLRK